MHSTSKMRTPHYIYTIGVWIRDVFHCTHYGRLLARKGRYSVFTVVPGKYGWYSDLTIFTGLKSLRLLLIAGTNFSEFSGDQKNR